MLNIRIEKTQHPKEKPDFITNIPGWGLCTTDHMFLMDYDKENGWHDARIVPYGTFAVDPACMAFHYAQEIFEGIKLFKNKDGVPLLFRLDQNAARFRRSAHRVMIPEIPEEDFIEAVKALVKVDKEWISDAPNTCLYMRPVCFASESAVGVRTADKYKFAIIACPVPTYPCVPEESCYIMTSMSRAGDGGTGGDKCGCNYAGTLLPQAIAESKGYSEVAFADATEHKYIGEISASNIMFVIDGKFVCPELDGTILPGITRDSLLYLCREMGIPVEERKVTVEEVRKALENGTCTEALSTGTAVAIEPLKRIGFEDGGDFTVGDGKTCPICTKLFDRLIGIQKGEQEAPEGWIIEVK